MAGCVFYDHVCKVEVLWAVVQPCRLRLCPQTAQEGGRGRRGRRQGGGLSLENGPGPRPALPWPSNCARKLTTCVYSMWAQMADRFRGLLCFSFFCLLLVFRQLIITVRIEKMHSDACTCLTEWSSFTALLLIFICSKGLEYEAWIQPDKWLWGILLIHSSLHIDLFLFIYLTA